LGIGSHLDIISERRGLKFARGKPGDARVVRWCRIYEGRNQAQFYLPSSAFAREGKQSTRRETIGTGSGRCDYQPWVRGRCHSLKLLIRPWPRPHHQQISAFGLYIYRSICAGGFGGTNRPLYLFIRAGKPQSKSLSRSQGLLVLTAIKDRSGRNKSLFNCALIRNQKTPTRSGALPDAQANIVRGSWVGHPL